ALPSTLQNCSTVRVGRSMTLSLSWLLARHGWITAHARPTSTIARRMSPYSPATTYCSDTKTSQITLRIRAAVFTWLVQVDEKMAAAPRRDILTLGWRPT